jgi:hypothetical protein
MTKKKKPAEPKPAEVKPKPEDISATARATIAQMTPEEFRRINKLILYTVNECDFPKFKVGLFKLGYDENSGDFQKLVELWDEYSRASRHP